MNDHNEHVLDGRVRLHTAHRKSRCCAIGGGGEKKRICRLRWARPRDQEVGDVPLDLRTHIIDLGER